MQTYLEKLKEIMSMSMTEEEVNRISSCTCPGHSFKDAPLVGNDKCEEAESCKSCWSSKYLGEILDRGKRKPNQEAKSDAGKPRLSLVPMQIVWDIAETREYGTKKYKDPDNWKRVEMDRYMDALLRHTLAFVEDHDSVDEESGLGHYKHMACNIAFICAMMKERDNK